MRHWSGLDPCFIQVFLEQFHKRLHAFCMHCPTTEKADNGLCVKGSRQCNSITKLAHNAVVCDGQEPRSAGKGTVVGLLNEGAGQFMLLVSAK